MVDGCSSRGVIGVVRVGELLSHLSLLVDPFPRLQLP